MPLSILIPLMLQVGPGGALPQAPLAIPKKKAEAVAPPPPHSDMLKDCLNLAMTRPADGIEVAEAWLAKAKTAQDRAGARQCHAMALTRIEGWAEAAPLFLAARADTPESQADERARLAALSGNASLAAQDPAAALVRPATAGRGHGAVRAHPLSPARAALLR